MKTLLRLAHLSAIAAAITLVSTAALAAEQKKAADRIPPGVVDGPTAHELVAEGVKVVDVRTPAEFEAGHVPGAVNIPFDQMGARAGELGPTTTPLLVYCHSGRRSGIAIATLKQKGFGHIYDLQAYDRWVASEPKKK